jgi:hypothetical protein
MVKKCFGCPKSRGGSEKPRTWCSPPARQSRCQSSPPPGVYSFAPYCHLFKKRATEVVGFQLWCRATECASGAAVVEFELWCRSTERCCKARARPSPTTRGTGSPRSKCARRTPSTSATCAPRVRRVGGALGTKKSRCVC